MLATDTHGLTRTFPLHRLGIGSGVIANDKQIHKDGNAGSGIRRGQRCGVIVES